MNNHPKKRTGLDLEFAAMEMIGGPQMVEAYRRELLPHLSPNPKLFEEISESEYQFWLSKIREELPYYLAYLRDFPVSTFASGIRSLEQPNRQSNEQ